MISKKAQGLPLSFIVIAAIAVLILILVVAFTIGGLGGFFKQMVTVGKAEDLSTVQSACNTACNKLVQIKTLEDFQASAYCTKSYTIDLNRDGKITKTDSGVSITGLIAGIHINVTPGLNQTPGGFGQYVPPSNCVPGVTCETSLRCWSKSVGISCRVVTASGQELIEDAGAQGGACEEGLNIKTP